MNENYKKVDFSSAIKDFVENSYLKAVLADGSAPSGEVVSEGNFSNIASAKLDNTTFSSIKIISTPDLEQVQIVLMEEFEEYPNELILLGSTFPDTVIENSQSEIYGYNWDGLWLGINGYPAYISDIHDYEVENDQGQIEYFTRLHIPAILNPGGEDEKDISIAYSYDEDFNITLESIIPETYSEVGETNIVAKERVNLKPGDKVQLLYESFNTMTDEEFFVVNDEAIFTIKTGNEDLVLEYDELEEGKYHLGYVLMDYSQNDTIIIDTTTFVVSYSSNSEIHKFNEIELYPNPANHSINIENKNFNGKEYSIKLYDIAGKSCFNQKYKIPIATINSAELVNGIYNVEVTSNNKIYVEKVIIKY